MRILTTQRWVNVVAALLVSAAAASTPLSYLLKPSEFRVKSDRIAHLHQLQAGTGFQSANASKPVGPLGASFGNRAPDPAPYRDTVASAR